MSNNKYPESVIKAFPAIKDMVFVRQLASLVPLAPDTTFDIYLRNTDEFFALVTTDYADPQRQSQELKGISGQNEFEFTNLIKPYDADGGTISVVEHDDMEDDFFVTTPYKNYMLCYYLANLKLSK